jgi:hypothetical protein
MLLILDVAACNIEASAPSLIIREGRVSYMAFLDKRVL